MLTRGNDGVNLIPAASGATLEAPAPAPAPSPVELAVMFDLDGTLVDTEQAWLDAVRRSIRALGYDIDDAALLQYEGATLEQASCRIIGAYDVDQPAAVIATLLEDTTLEALEGNIEWRPGAEALLAELASAGVPMALVTSSTRRWLDTVARHVDLSAIAHFVTADDIAFTKPHPAPYLRGAELLGVLPQHCVVFEDSHVGTEAALAAGCVSVLVQPSGEAWTELVHAIAPTFVGIDRVWVAGALKLTSD